MPADPAEPTLGPLPPVEYDDYRLTLLGIDAASVSLVVLGAVAGENEAVAGTFIGLGLAGYAFGAPIVHFQHHQTGRAVGSFALRVGLPTPGVLIAAMGAKSCESDTAHSEEYGDESGWCALAAVAFGGFLAVGGALTAMIIDDSVLGKAPKPWRPDEKAREKSSFSLAVAPFFEPRRKTAGLSLAGGF